MYTLDQVDCRPITAPLSLSLFLASQVTSFSQLCFSHHHHRPISTRKSVLDRPLRSTVNFSSPTRFTHKPLKLTHIKQLKISACSDHHNSTVPVTDRLISAVIYSLPLLDGIGYGSLRIPPYQYPRIYASNQCTRFAVFYAIHMFVIRNPKLRKYVRLNALQSTILGFVITLPSWILKSIISPIWPVGMMIGFDFMFTVLVLGFVYIMVNTIMGKTPELPMVSDAARMQLGIK